MNSNVLDIKRIVIVAISFMLVTSISFANIDAEIQQSQQKKDEFQRQIDAKRAEIISEKAELSKAEEEYYKLQNEIQVIDKQIQETQVEIEDKKKSIEVKKEEVEIASLTVENQNSKLNQRLRTMYMLGDTGYIEILLKADSLMNMLTRIDRIQSLLDYDKKLLSELKIAKQDLETAKKLLEKEKEDLEVLKIQEEEEKDRLTKSLARAEEIKKELQNSVASLELEKRLFEAEQEAITKYIKTLEKRKEYVGGSMGWPLPLNRNRITSFFGPRRSPTPGATTNHGAIDVGTPTGTPVYAAQAGTVEMSMYLGSYGNFVLIDHGGGLETAYAHNSQRLVKKGQVVQKGEKIALSGNTGRSTGPHLHFEVRKNGTRVDPLNYVVRPQ